jgi:aspartyl protease family protein
MVLNASRTSRYFFAFVVSMCFLSPLTHAYNIQAQALLKNTAVLMIDGKRRTLKAGQRSPEGILLISASPQKAIIEINDQQQQLTLTQRISGNYQSASKREVTIPRDRAKQFLTNASINGKRIPVMVDTGANIVALSSAHAQRLDIDYLNGQPSRVTTASGEATSYIITLRSVDVGGIIVSGVKAAVIEGDFPVTILLGMSYLQHVTIQEKDGTLTLQAKY